MVFVAFESSTRTPSVAALIDGELLEADLDGALAHASDATRIDFALPRRDEHQQRVVFALAVDHAFRLHPDAAFVVVSRLDVTYCRAMRRPNGTLWRASLGVGVGTAFVE